MLSQTIYMEQVSSKNYLAFAKTNDVSKYMLSVLKLCYSQHKYKHSGKKILLFHYVSHVWEKWISKFEIYQISKIRKMIKQVASEQ